MQMTLRKRDGHGKGMKTRLSSQTENCVPCIPGVSNYAEQSLVSELLTIELSRVIMSPTVQKDSTLNENVCVFVCVEG